MGLHAGPAQAHDGPVQATGATRP
ncbi:MAG: hypothetical protein QOC80_1500, partial [Frankiaceae bacterium]|nr:hypothetical protein [Frankiaceae bacterium]